MLVRAGYFARPFSVVPTLLPITPPRGWVKTARGAVWMEEAPPAQATTNTVSLSTANWLIGVLVLALGVLPLGLLWPRLFRSDSKRAT